MKRKSILRKLFPIALAIAWGLMINSVLLGGFSNVMAYDYPPGTLCSSKQMSPTCWCDTFGCYRCIACSTGTCNRYRSSGCPSSVSCPSDSCTQ